MSIEKQPKHVVKKTNYDLSDFPDDIAERIRKVDEKSGFVPNVFLKMAERPSEFRAFFA